MKTMRNVLTLLAIAVSLTACGRASSAQEKPAPPPIEGEAVTSSASYFDVESDRMAPDFTLTNQDGQSVSLIDFRGSYVLLNFVYLSCPDICPLMTANFRRVQDELGDRLGSGVYMLSITLDPEYDTPERLKAYAEAFKADLSGWHFLTGDLETVYQVAEDYQQTFEVQAPRNIDHTALTVLIDPAGQERHRYWGTGYPPALVVEHIEALGLANAEQAGEAMADESTPEELPLPDQAEIDALLGIPKDEYVLMASEWEAEDYVVALAENLLTQGWTKAKSRYGQGQEALFFNWGEEMYIGIGRSYGAVVIMQDPDPVRLWTDFFEQFNLYCCG